jgi:NADPH:quinone reductase-like Zn-dependent oxidoreductase
VERTVWPWIHAGIIRPVIDRTMPMAEAPEAHRLLADGAVTGKVLLTP